MSEPVATQVKDLVVEWISVYPRSSARNVSLTELKDLQARIISLVERHQAEDQAAIRVLWNRMRPSHTAHCLTPDSGCGLRDHAAAIQRAREQEGK